MLSRVAICMDLASAYARGVVRGVAAYAATNARTSWVHAVFSKIEEPGLDYLEDMPKWGFIGAIAYESPAMNRVLRTGLPTVCVSGHAPTVPVPRVRTDDYAIGVRAAEHLLSLGLRHFAYHQIGGGERLFARRRYQGFRDTVVVAGASCARFCRSRTPSKTLADWISALPKPVGVLGSTDQEGVEVIEACRDLSLSVPDDVAVVGVDNFEMMCESTLPSLSSITQLPRKIGYEAAAVLMRLIEGQKHIPDVTLIEPGPVIVRGSSDGIPTRDPLVREAMVFLREHFSDRMKVDNVADTLSVSRATLDNRFKEALGRTPAAELRRLQISHAQQLLHSTEQSLEAIARLAGFANARRFSEAFHREVGITPSAYRKSHR